MAQASPVRACAAVVLLVVAWLTAVGEGRAQGDRSADEKRRDDLARNVETGRSVTRIAAQVAVAAVGLTLVGAGYAIGRKGIEVGKGKRMTGRPAWALGGVLAAVGLAVGIVGVLYVPTVLGSR